MRTVRSVDFCSGVPRPVLRGWLHVLMASVTVVAGSWLISATPGRHRWAVVVYAVSLLGCFGVSSVYHTAARSRTAQNGWRRADHAMINVLVAGTATPVYAVGVGGRFGALLTGTVWLFAAVGVVLKSLGAAWRAATVLYPLSGWVALLAVPRLWGSVGPVPVMLLVAGGLVYSAGAICFAAHRPRLSPGWFGFHEFWHACTGVAAGAQFVAVCYIVS